MRQCPYAKSDTTPCVLRDGEICFAMDSRDLPICVGCERSPKAIGVPFPRDWTKIVAKAKKGKK
jgi:predicted Fe-S protein YdhL (DUF1289 family)